MYQDFLRHVSPLFSPNHLVHHPRIALNQLHNLGRYILIRIIGHRQTIVLIPISSGSYYKMTITPDSTYVISNSGDKVDLSNGMSVTARVEYDKLTYFEYAMEALGVLFR